MPLPTGCLGCVATRGGPMALLPLVFNLTRALGRAAIAFNSLTNVPLFRSGLAPNRPTTPVPPQRKQVGLAPRQVQSGTPIEYNGAAAITTGSSQTSLARRAVVSPHLSRVRIQLRRRSRVLAARCAPARQDGSSYQIRFPAQRARPFMHGAGGILGGPRRPQMGKFG